MGHRMLAKLSIALGAAAIILVGGGKAGFSFDRINLMKMAKPGDMVIKSSLRAIKVQRSTSTAQAIHKKNRIPVTVKGIYVSANAAGTQDFMDKILNRIETTEINAVVIDVKNDDGRVTFAMDNPVVNEVNAVVTYIPDIEKLMGQLKERGIYTIARIVAFRDPYMAEQKPGWMIKDQDGSVYKDKDGKAWLNPYRQEVWDYLVDIGIKAGEAGFDEVQFDYMRFAADKTMNQMAFDEGETKGRSKTQIITDFARYASGQLRENGLFVSADVFGTIIESDIDADAVGQSFNDLAGCLDYICPMIYPSHYGKGNFGIEYPDTKPYDTILAALHGAKRVLTENEDSKKQAIVRPWLQDFTASYLEHYIRYGPEEVRAEIQAVYDSGYEEWILWDAACNYTWGGLLPEDNAAEVIRY